jgi:AcrR family transcriptional regulator
VSAVAATRSRTRLGPAERREQILACARALFREHTYASVSTEQIARRAGVARGLVNHYFGTKRELYLEVVRELVHLAPPPLPTRGQGRSLEQVAGDSVELWLHAAWTNRRTWLAAMGAQGFGRDAELEQIIDEAREVTVDRLIAVLDPPGGETPALRAVLRAYGGLAEAGTREWLERGSLSREGLRVLLTDALVALTRDTLPRLIEGPVDG